MTVFHQTLDEYIEKDSFFTPIEKERLRGVFCEVQMKYYRYIAVHKPASDLVFDVKKLLIEHMGAFNNLNMDKIAHAIRAFNSKVPDDCQLNADYIQSVCGDIKERVEGSPKPALKCVR